MLAVDAANPGLIGTCSASNHNFLFQVVRALRVKDTRWGLNWKRGIVGSLSEDIVDYARGNPPFENSTFVFIMDVVSGCGSPGANPSWLDQTQATANAGTIGRWTCSTGC